LTVWRRLVSLARRASSASLLRWVFGQLETNE
jgi:hypothetical protein